MANRIVQSLNFVQNKDYKYQIERDQYKTHPEEVLGLYKVQLFNDKIVYVFAESEQGAIGQATCGEADHWQDCKDLEKGAMAIRVKFKLRGWGGELF